MLERRMTWALAAALVAAILAGAPGRAMANACGSQCRADYNQCRLKTKGSASCEAQFTRCMQGCIRK